MRSKQIREIRNYVYENKTVALEQICNRFTISKRTLSRHLNEIIEDSPLMQTYGNLTVLSNKEMTSFEERTISNKSAEIAIAAVSANLIEDGDIIFVDSGTTMSHIIDHLKNKKNITLLTNNIEIIMRAIPYNNINIISLSGSLNRKTLSLTGPNAVMILQAFNINKAFIATTGYSVACGLTCSSHLDDDLKRTAIQRSKEIYLLADSSKCGSVSLITYCSLSKVNILITEKSPPADIVRYIKENGGTILLTNV